MIEVLAPGLLTTVQDRGRPGLERFGIPRGGPVDRFAALAANRLVGNDPNAALLECTVSGPALRFAADALVVVTGGQVTIDASWSARAFPAGSTLTLGPIGPGLRAYLAVRGGIEVEVVLNSRSLCQRGGFGGGFGRPLQRGDRLPVGRQVGDNPMTGPWSPEHRLPLGGPWEVRVIGGPHVDVFPPDALPRLLSTACLVTPQIDRMGMRLKTPALRMHPPEILTTPVPEGAIQVTPSGELIALLADHQTTGGYPVIATVIDADLPLLAQARPGDTIHFRSATHADALRARRRLQDWLTG